MLINKGKSIYRKIFPKRLRILIRKIFKIFLYNFRLLKFKVILIFAKEVNIILGAALTSQKDWISTNEEWFDITKKKDWQKLFKNKRKLKRALAEHVFEHLSESEMKSALNLIYYYLIKDGTLRIAVPDGNHPNPIYREHTGINGKGADASDHKQFITYEYLKSELENCGFKCILREGYMSDGTLVNEKLTSELGFIIRSRNNKSFNMKYGWDFESANSSLIVDAYK
tara:strand:+ start:119 stop:799 length:681 start_codon:yes stop_codon:yes gene_type:complete